MAGEPIDGTRLGTIHRDGRRRVERDGLVHVAREFNRQRQRRQLDGIGIRLVAGKQRHRQGENRQADELRMANVTAYHY